MDDFEICLNNLTQEDKYLQIIEKLKSARQKISPIIDDIIFSTLILLQENERKNMTQCSLTTEQARDIVWAAQVLKEIEAECVKNKASYTLPNTDLTVHNASVTNTAVIVDEELIKELIDLHERMGVIINRLCTEATPVTTTDFTTDEQSLDDLIDQKSRQRSINKSSHRDLDQSKSRNLQESFHDDRSRSRSIHDSSITNLDPSRSKSVTRSTHESLEPSRSRSSHADLDSSRSKSMGRSSHVDPSKSKSINQELDHSKSKSVGNVNEDLSESPVDDLDYDTSRSKHEYSDQPQSKSRISFSPALTSSEERNVIGSTTKKQSTLSNLGKSSSGELKKSDMAAQRSKEEAAGTTIFIRIKCFSDEGSESEGEMTSKHCDMCENCDPPHIHIKMNGEPVTLKVDDAEFKDGGIYCIDTGCEDPGKDVKIMIKKCPDCCSTVIASSSIIQSLYGESPESVTLHGKGGDESKMEDTSDEDVTHKSITPIRPGSSIHEPQKSFRSDDLGGKESSIHEHEPSAATVRDPSVSGSLAASASTMRQMSSIHDQDMRDPSTRSFIEDQSHSAAVVGKPSSIIPDSTSRMKQESFLEAQSRSAAVVGRPSSTIPDSTSRMKQESFLEAQSRSAAVVGRPSSTIPGSTSRMKQESFLEAQSRSASVVGRPSSIIPDSTSRMKQESFLEAQSRSAAVVGRPSSTIPDSTSRMKQESFLEAQSRSAAVVGKPSSTILDSTSRMKQESFIEDESEPSTERSAVAMKESTTKSEMEKSVSRMRQESFTDDQTTEEPDTETSVAAMREPSIRSEMQKSASRMKQESFIEGQEGTSGIQMSSSNTEGRESTIMQKSSSKFGGDSSTEEQELSTTVMKQKSSIHDQDMQRSASAIKQKSSVIAPQKISSIAEEGSPLCHCEEMGTTCKMDVVLDVDNVAKSTVRFTGTESINFEDYAKRYCQMTPSSENLPDPICICTKPPPSTTSESQVPAVDTTPPPSVPPKTESVIPLPRGRICSSMEFDVSTVHTKLRETGIEHPNSVIVVELKNLGVDKILRACRPAKCCRRAILNEKQKVALPYSVSLRSLPLMANDVDVIKQSIDMSVKKIKNSTNINQEYKNKMAYYVSLGKLDFKPTINFPWVAPVYEIKLNDGKLPQKLLKKYLDNHGDCRHHDKMYVSRKSTESEDIMQDASRLFLIKKPSQIDSQQQSVELNKNETKESETNQGPPSNSQNFILKPSLKRSKVLKRGGAYLVQKSRDIRLRVHFEEDTDSSKKNKTITHRLKRVHNETLLLSKLPPNTEQKTFKLKKFTTEKTFATKSIRVDDTGNSNQFLNNMSEISLSNNSCDLTPLLRLSSLLKAKFSDYKVTKHVEQDGDHLVASVRKILDEYAKKVKNTKVEGTTQNISKSTLPRVHSDSTIANKEKTFKMVDLERSSWENPTDEVFYANSSVSVFTRRRKSVEKVPNCVKIPRLSKSELRLSKTQSPVIDKKKVNLQYYVGLFDDNFVWGKISSPQDYTTMFFNFKKWSKASNKKDSSAKSDKKNSSGNKIEKDRKLTTASRQSTSGAYSISSTDTLIRRSSSQKADKETDSVKSATTNATQTLPVNDSNEIEEQVARKERLLALIKELTSPDMLYIDSKQPKKTVEGVYQMMNVKSNVQSCLPPLPSEKPSIANADWAPLLISETSLPKLKLPEKSPEIHPASPVVKKSECKSCKKTHSKKIEINIEKKSGKVNIVNKSCGDKEICEIFKNKALVQDKPKCSKDLKNVERYVVKGEEENIRILIKNNKVCLLKGQDGKCCHKREKKKS